MYAIRSYYEAISVKSTMKALEGVKIKLSNDNLYLTGYDLELGIKAQISVTSSDEVEFIINARLFNDIIRKMPTEEIEIEISDNFTVTITGGATQYTISAISAEEYPSYNFV